MSQYIMRLDDASEYMDVEKWQRMEDLLDKYHIKPIVGVIPDNQDSDMVESIRRTNSSGKRSNVGRKRAGSLHSMAIPMCLKPERAV